MLYGDRPRPFEGREGTVGDRLLDLEIRDYFAMLRRRIWIVVLVPLIAAGTVLARNINRPTEYSATATVTASWLIGAPGSHYEGSNGVSSFVADFIAASTQRGVVAAAAETSGVSARGMRERITATAIGESALIEVSYVTTDRDEAEPVAQAVASETLSFLFSPQVEAAEAAAAAAEEDTGDEEAPPDPSVVAAARMVELLEQPQTVQLAPTVVRSAGSEMIQKLEVAIGAGIFLALFLVVLLEVVLPRRTERGLMPDESYEPLPEGGNVFAGKERERPSAEAG